VTLVLDAQEYPQMPESTNGEHSRPQTMANIAEELWDNRNDEELVQRIVIPGLDDFISEQVCGHDLLTLQSMPWL
jgi:hypothetical protein